MLSLGTVHAAARVVNNLYIHYKSYNFLYIFYTRGGGGGVRESFSRKIPENENDKESENYGI